MASRAAGKTPLETVNRSVFENQLEAFKIVNQEISKVFGASAAFAAIKPKGTAGFLSQYNTYVQYLDEMISHFNKNKEIARKNQRNERLEIDCTPFLIFERSITRVFAMLLSKQKKYKNELNAISILLTPLRELVKIINENQINEINLLRFEDIEKIDIDLFYFIKEKADAMAKYNIEMTRSTTDALCNYEKNNKGRIEKLRAKEHFQVDMFQDQVVYYGITTSYLDLISRYENKTNKKFPPSQQLIYLPPIRRESPALRALPLSNEAARSASPVPNIPRIRASEIQASVPMLSSGRPTQTPPRSPVHARILSKSRSSRRIGQSGLMVAATSTTPTKTPPAENQPRALPDVQQAPIVAPDEPTHADSMKESQKYAAPDEKKHVDSQRESQESDVQTASETNPYEPERTASNPPEQGMNEETNETLIDKNMKPKLFKATEPLEHLEKDRISPAEVDKKPEESVDNEEENMVIDKDIGTEPIENNDVEAEKDIKEDDVEESSEVGEASEVHDQVADEENPPGDVDPTPSPSVSPPPSEADEPKSSESQIGDNESRSPGTSEVGNRGDSDSVTSKNDRSVDGMKEVDVESSESSESPERDDLPVQREAESDQENRDEEDSGDADSSNPNYSNNDESQEAPESPRQVPVASPQAEDDSGDGEAESSDSEDEEEPAAQPEYPEDPASLDAENNGDSSEAVAVGDSSSSEDTADDSEEPEAVEEPDAPEEHPVQVPEVSPREEQESSEDDTDNESEQASDNRESQEAAEDSREEQPEEVPRGDRESSEDDTDDVSEQASDNRVSSESAEDSGEEKTEEVPVGDNEEDKTDVGSSGGESQGSPESPASPEEPIHEDEPSVDPVDPVDSEESLESPMSPEPESNERSVPIQEDPQPVVGAVSSIDTKEAESFGTPHKRSAEPVEPEETPQKRQKLDDSAQRSPEHPME